MDPEKVLALVTEIDRLFKEYETALAREVEKDLCKYARPTAQHVISRQITTDVVLVRVGSRRCARYDLDH